MPYELVTIGTSLGGLNALESILNRLAPGFRTPIAVVQHRGVLSTGSLAGTLRRYTDLQVREAQDKEPILPGRITLAPPDYHLMVDGAEYALTTEAPVLFARPSIDVLFQSASDAYGSRLLAILLTGASRDGAAGAAHVKSRGGGLVVQEPASAECSVMPRAAIEAVTPNWVLPVEKIGPLLNHLQCTSGNGK